MSIDKINHNVYASSDGINPYDSISLQPPEISIFIKHRNSFYNKNVLDIGVGLGRTSFHLRNFAKKYIGIDYSNSMVEVGSKKYPELDLQHGDARDLSRFSDKSFDFILFSYNGIDYVSHSDRLKILKEIKRILKDDGIFVFSTHNKNFNAILTKPELHTSLNPVRFLKNFFSYIKQIKNKSILKNEEIENSDYSLINDSGNDFALLTYYISKDKQISQLNDIDFSVIEMLDMQGQIIQKETDDSDNCWIYFVTQHKSS